jgi:predicted transcriptional regulator
MSKAVMLSIRPKWVEKIANGEKTIEVRKTRPKLDTPFKCYIYCTLPKYPHEDFIATNYPMPQFYGGGKVIGEFTCDRIDRLAPANEPYGIYDIDDDYVFQTCLENGALWDYGHGTPLYGWHISGLKIYDMPKKLSEFFPVCRYKNDDKSCPSRRVACSYQKYDYNPDGSINLVECGRTLERPPQSWCYVEEG